MFPKADWAKFVDEQEKLVANKLSDVEITKTNELPQTEASSDESEQFSLAEVSLLQKIIRKGLVENKNDLEIQRQDPNSPLYSVKTFEALELKPNLLKGVYEMGFNAPSKIQETALPTLLADPPQNLIAQSQSGTGKTAAFVLAMLSRVKPELKYPQVLCLSPTYELAVQTGEVAAHMVKYCPEIELKSAVRGEEVYEIGFNASSKIQETALPTLLADPLQNLIAQSQSGTEKTAALVLVMLSHVKPELKYPQKVLCLSPTYDLALALVQTSEVAAHMVKCCPKIELKCAVRGEEVPRGTKLTEHVIIGTPGKVLDWALKFHVFDLCKISVFVLDEADVMIATQGHQDQCIRIHKCLSSTCQMMFFSATYDQQVMDFAEIIVKNPIIIRLKREEESLDNIKQYYVKCANQQEKYNAVTNIYGTVGVGQAIIFCHTRRAANWLAEKMSKDGHAVAVLTGELSVEQRIHVLDRFRNGTEKVLITTNVLSRGIDVEQVTIVVNFDLPVDISGQPDCETYLHRIGRTGRFGKHGIAINLVDSSDSMAICQAIEKHFGRKIKYLNADDSDEIEKIGA